jgi:PAS domain S-box-containing protein
MPRSMSPEVSPPEVSSPEVSSSEVSPTATVGRLGGVASGLFELMGLGIVITNESGRVIETNRTARTLLGLAESDAPSGGSRMPSRSFVRADGTNLAPGDHPHERALREGRGIVEEQVGMVGADGETTWLNIAATPVPGVGVMTVYGDVTLGRRAQEDVRHHLDQLDALFGTNLDLLLIFNSEGRTVRFNPAWETLLGYDSDKLDGARILDLVHPADMEATLGALARLRTPHEVVGFVNRVRTCDGNYRYLEWRATARDDLVYATARDITDQRLAEADLRESEARFRAIFEQAAVGVAEVDRETGRFIRVNERLCEILGYTSEELCIRTFQDITHAEDLSKSVAGLKRFLTGESREFNCEKRYIHKSGRVVWIALQVRSLGAARDYVTVVQDISERKEADECLRQSLTDTMELNQRLNFQVTRMPLGYITWDRDFRVIQWNASAERIFGFTAGEAIGKHANELIVPMEARPIVARAWKAVVEGGDLDHHLVNDNCTRDGRRIVCEWFNAPWIDTQGTIVGCFSMVYDVTDRRRLEERVLRSQKMASLGSFAGGVAHDISHVLRTILSRAEAIQTDAPEAAKLAKNMDTIVRACRKGRTLVRGLLDFARQDLADAKVFDLNQVLDEQLGLLAVTLAPAIRIDKELDPELPPVRGDELALGGAFMHLLLNARESMPKGGVLTVRTCRHGENDVKIDVDDTGCGMSKEILDHAMEPFFTTKAKGRGAGLGLPAVYGAVRAHQGHIDIHSEPRRGTQVQITLPVTAAVGVRSSGLHQGADDSTDALASIGLRILLVDDDDQVQTAVSAQLRRLGHSVTIAGHGQDALDKIQAGLEVDLVLLDVDMPVLDGGKTLPRLRALRPGLPVIVETGNLNERTEDIVAKHADIRLLIKPFSLSELKAAIDSHRN